MNYGIIKDGKIVSLGYVSNIVNNLANIVIQTEKEYRGQGFATKVVEKVARECIKQKLIPTYWVNTKNIESEKVARKLGFKAIGREKVLFADE